MIATTIIRTRITIHNNFLILLTLSWQFMAYDHEEQEQLETIKAWWHKYGNLVTWALIVVLAGFGGWQVWGKYQSKQSEQAAELFEEQQKAVEAKDSARILRVATDIQEQYSRSTYGQMSALVAAKSAIDANDAAGAKKQLQWVLDNGSGNEYKAIAATRLAGLLLDEKAYDEALKVLNGKFPDEFASVIADRKGDIYSAQDKVQEARAAFALALEKATAQDPARQLIQLKLDAIGGAPEKKVS
jgi:predicted negative regulator of RcsB-dependent stress response